MIIGGLQKTSLVDFPGRVACTVFTQGCNFACPFCHNKDLISFGARGQHNVLSLLGFLEKRKRILDGVCITGGEPCLQVGLDKFCRQIKDLGLEVKLDTNGSRPEVLEGLLKQGLVDMVAMDIKSCFGDYGKTTQIKNQISKIKKSIKIILDWGGEYEFRTTVVPGIHNGNSLMELAKELRRIGGKEMVWILQKFRASPNCLDKKYRQMESFGDEEMEGFLRGVRGVLPGVRLRM